MKEKNYFAAETAIIKNCKIGKGTKIWPYANIYGCEIGENCMIGAFVEMQNDVKIGNNVRVQSHSFLCSLVTIEDDVFVGHGVMFINDTKPPSNGKSNWRPTTIKKKATIGSNATLLPVTIGENAVVGAGAVVTKDVPPNTIVAGNPAKELKKA